MDVPADTQVVCVECGRESEGDARGWRAFLTDTDEPAVYCAACGEREFGGRGVGFVVRRPRLATAPGAAAFAPFGASAPRC
jgi:DNA-directed RNA polymerase subunit RPC12/RpoP